MDRLLTDDEVVEILRLDVGRRQPKEALKNMRRTGRIGYVRVGKRVLYKPEHVREAIAAGEVSKRR